MTTILKKIDLEQIEAGNQGLPEDGTYETTGFRADVAFEFDRSDKTVRLEVEGMWLKRKDLKELRRFLKLIEAELP